MIRPCIHPRCDDGYGNRRLTAQTMCDPCRRHYRRQIDWIVQDYVWIKVYMPSPIRHGDGGRGVVQNSFGHPAEWASDTCRDIAGMLNDAETTLRAHLTHSLGPDESAPEVLRVESAYAYLTGAFADLCTYPKADVICEGINDTHQTIRRDLGRTRFQQRLPVPCPTCDVAALVRYVGQIECGECGRRIAEEQYPMFTRIAIDYLIDSYDTLKQQELDVTGVADVN